MPCLPVREVRNIRQPVLPTRRFRTKHLAQFSFVFPYRSYRSMPSRFNLYAKLWASSIFLFHSSGVYKRKSTGFSESISQYKSVSSSLLFVVSAITQISISLRSVAVPFAWEPNKMIFCGAQISMIWRCSEAIIHITALKYKFMSSFLHYT